MLPRFFHLFALFFVLGEIGLGGLGSVALGENWPRFRGPNGTGIAPAISTPNEWTKSDYAWEVTLKGLGHSSPVVWGEQVYITSCEPTSGEVFLDAYEVATGKLAWRRSLTTPTSTMHLSNSYAATTPAVDGQRIYLSWGSKKQVHMAAFTHAGDEVWRRKLGAFDGQHGFAASPVVVGEVVCLQGDTSEGGYLVALETATGAPRWRAERPAGKESYSTPVVIALPSGRQAIILTSTTAGIEAIDPNDGHRLWQQADALPARAVSSPVVAGEMILATSGSGGNGKQLSAVRLVAGGCEPVYQLTRNVPYVPTPVVKDDLLFLWHERGTVTCAELATGEKIWTKRVGGKFFGSPILMGERLLALSMSGEAVMLAASRDYKVLGRTDLGEPTEATPAVASGRLFLRTETELKCLQEQE